MEAQENDDQIFVYMGGDQRVPGGVRRARIHESVKIILERAFYFREHLISVEFHDGIEIIEGDAFNNCRSLRGAIKLLGVRVVKQRAFNNCYGLTDAEFGNKLETIGRSAFYECTSLRTIKMPSVRTIGGLAFYRCKQLTDLDLPEGLETIGESAFCNSTHLRHITMSLKDGMIGDRIFIGCKNLTTIVAVGGIHKTIASLHLGSWRNELTNEINRINQVLPNTDSRVKTRAIQQWMTSVIRRLNHYKTEHQKILKEATTLLELAVWKAKIDQNEERLKSETNRERRMQRITSGASIIIKNVLPFLELN